PMVLGPQGPGRVGRRQANNHKDRYRLLDNGLFLIFNRTFTNCRLSLVGLGDTNRQVFMLLK
ncbi:hypothetical protein, partial [Paenibacillus solani]|uniref:hypothetical protein n=1 Tax=Paenibacillus solani TaxID=1705565 RepID=UPI001A947FF0